MTKNSVLIAEEPATDLAIATAMAGELEEYIVKDDLYRTLIVRTPTGDQNLQMSGGDLLARLHRLQAERGQLSAAQQSQLAIVQKQVAETIYSLRTRFHQRLQREVKARLDSLKWFLDDAMQDAKRARIEFPFEMRNRQRIEEILRELSGELPAELRERLTAVDARIRMVAHGGDFIWDERLKAAFPPSPYWYLYVSP